MFGWFKKPEKRLRLLVQSEADVLPVSALLQDAALRGEDIAYDPKARTLTLRLNRFCHERGGKALRVVSALQIGDVTAIRSRGFNLTKPPLGLSILSLSVTPAEAPSCVIDVAFAGKAHPQLQIEVECLDMVLVDLAAPHRARSVPQHPET
ncbi:DUF2948 family protein [Asticcacaulis tiandongensis]|uniref:DUF2948 family protein n=1 Tax=Asticcacaulis tiandongensis TaxID=2565365 RepID=UPI001FEBA57D|nr:DUF2948 family protein [Asticcacaulis tiandongensis]